MCNTAHAPPEVAQVYAFIGDIDAAFEWLQRSNEEGNDWAAVDSEWNALRDDPRWQPLMGPGFSSEELAAIEFKVTLP